MPSKPSLEFSNLGLTHGSGLGLGFQNGSFKAIHYYYYFTITSLPGLAERNNVLRAEGCRSCGESAALNVYKAPNAEGEEGHMLG